MIVLKKFNLILEKPSDFSKLKTEVKNHIFENLDIGYCVFKIPDFIENKSQKVNYKTGFLDDLLSILNPKISKKNKCEIISDKYHMMFTYRRYLDIIKDYNEDKKKYGYFR